MVPLRSGRSLVHLCVQSSPSSRPGTFRDRYQDDLYDNVGTGAVTDCSISLRPYEDDLSKAYLRVKVMLVAQRAREVAGVGLRFPPRRLLR